jgi:hypothetical protein
VLDEPANVNGYRPSAVELPALIVSVVVPDPPAIVPDAKLHATPSGKPPHDNAMLPLNAPMAFDVTVRVVCPPGARSAGSVADRAKSGAGAVNGFGNEISPPGTLCTIIAIPGSPLPLNLFTANTGTFSAVPSLVAFQMNGLIHGTPKLVPPLNVPSPFPKTTVVPSSAIRSRFPSPFMSATLATDEIVPAATVVNVPSPFPSNVDLSLN